MSQVTAVELKIIQLENIPPEQKKISNVPLLKKQLKEVEKKRDVAKHEHDKLHKELL